VKIDQFSLNEGIALLAYLELLIMGGLTN
jgi:hypothetical protein